MAKHKKEWTEAELIDTFGLYRIIDYQTPLMEEWLATEPPIFDSYEQHTFDDLLKRVVASIAGWSEEDLKMKFISFLLPLGYLSDNGKFLTFFEKTLTGNVEGITLSVRSDFMVAKGILNLPKKPYFHFQEYKPSLNPSGEPMAQLLEAFLIAQEKNKDGKPMYGAEIIGKQWTFVVMKGKEYCISKSYDCTDREELLQIIAILRKFRKILETRLLD
jgi:hypothetical protein